MSLYSSVSEHKILNLSPFAMINSSTSTTLVSLYRPDPMYVSGTAAYAVPPELAIINMGLDVLKQTASDALQESANTM